MQLAELVNLARLSASARNSQTLKYALAYDAQLNAKIFDCLAWAGYLTDWSGPEEGQRPSGYIVILHDRSIYPEVGCDHGIAAQSILLGAVEMELGGCMIGAIKKEKLKQILRIPDNLDIELVIALGKPAETVVIDPVTDDIKYWRDENDIHHVPKRSLEEIII
jgi:nitroreductase